MLLFDRESHGTTPSILARSAGVMPCRSKLPAARAMAPYVHSFFLFTRGPGRLGAFRLGYPPKSRDAAAVPDLAPGNRTPKTSVGPIGPVRRRCGRRNRARREGDWPQPSACRRRLHYGFRRRPTLAPPVPAAGSPAGTSSPSTRRKRHGTGHDVASSCKHSENRRRLFRLEDSLARGPTSNPSAYPGMQLTPSP